MGVRFILAKKLHFLATEQIALLRNTSVRSALSWARRLERDGLAEIRVFLGHESIPLECSLIAFKPGDPVLPPFGEIAYRLQIRLRNVPVRQFTLVAATAKLRRKWGGACGRWPRPVDVTHDKMLADLFIRLGQPKGWMHEAELYRRGWGRHSRLPDAVLRVKKEKQKLLEMGGSGYDGNHLRSLHDFAVSMSFPYEVY